MRMPAVQTTSRRIGISGIILVSACVAVLACAAGSLAADQDSNQMTVVFRYDDYSSRSNAALEQQIFRTFEKYHARISVGVVPSICAVSCELPIQQCTVPLTAKKARILRGAVKDGAAEVVQHGYCHRNLGRSKTNPRGLYTEFVGRTFADQMKCIADGRREIENAVGVRVGTFIPPWNNYDSNTLRALERLGFTTISAGTNGPATESCKLKFVPKTTEITQVRQAVQSARRMPDSDAIIVVQIHPYDFTEVDKYKGVTNLPTLDDTVGWLASQKDVRMLSFGQLAEKDRDLGVQRLFDNRAYQNPHPGLPSFMGYRPGDAYISSQSVRRMMSRLWALAAAFYFALFLLSAAGFFIGAQVVSRLDAYRSVKYFGAAAILLYAAYAFGELEFGYRGITGTAVGLGAYIGLLSALAFSRRPSD